MSTKTKRTLKVATDKLTKYIKRILDKIKADFTSDTWRPEASEMTFF